MTTAQEIFNTTMALIDEVNEATGETDTGDTREYKLKTLFILNLLRGELYPYSDTYTLPEDDSKRPIAQMINSFDEPIGLDDYICQTVMPHGLAAYLLLDENPSVASFFNQKYNELKITLMRGKPSVSVDIEDVYGGIRYNEFSSW